MGFIGISTRFRDKSISVVIYRLTADSAIVRS